jgi:hypothetical protein
MQYVPVTIRTSPVYDISDDDLPPVQDPNHLLNPPDLPLIEPDITEIKQALHTPAGIIPPYEQGDRKCGCSTTTLWT